MQFNHTSFRLTLAAVLVAEIIVLSGCGGSKPSSAPEPTENSKVATQPTEQVKAEVEVEVDPFQKAEITIEKVLQNNTAPKSQPKIRPAITKTDKPAAKNVSVSEPILKPEPSPLPLKVTPTPEKDSATEINTAARIFGAATPQALVEQLDKRFEKQTGKPIVDPRNMVEPDPSSLIKISTTYERTGNVHENYTHYWSEDHDTFLKHGPYEKWHDNGELASKGDYLHGVPHGLARSWYEDGTRRIHGSYEYGELAGVGRMWHPDGLLRGAVYVENRIGRRLRPEEIEKLNLDD